MQPFSAIASARQVVESQSPGSFAIRMARPPGRASRAGPGGTGPWHARPVRAGCGREPMTAGGAALAAGVPARE